MEFNEQNENNFDDSVNNFEETKKEIELPYEVALKDPFDFGKDRYVTSITFHRRPTFGMMEHMPVDQKNIRLGHMKPILAGMSKEMPALIGKLSQRDLMACLEVVNVFL